MKRKILILVGPTSSGKSALAVQLARSFNGEVISADSRQVYRGLTAGTGKITKKEMRGIEHHLLDVASPKRVFTAHDFLRLAHAAIEDIAQRGKLPIVAGGTGFYVDALTGRILLPDVPADPKLRAVLEKKPPEQLFSFLQKRDPRRAKDIDPHNRRRLIRALEIAAALGKSPRPLTAAPYDTLWLGLRLPRKDLDRKIARRLLGRMGAMLAEAKRLHKRGLSFKRMEGLGLEYRSLARLMQKKITHPQLQKELTLAIRQYAKRQITYWKRNKKIEWFAPTQKKEIEKRILKWKRS